jgi:tyrosine-protein phosphatase SIW14
MITHVSRSLYRGPRPDLPMLDELFLKMGVRTLINLEKGWFEFLHGHEHQESLAAERIGFAYGCSPLSDFGAPSKADLDLIFQCINGSMAAGDGVYVHCLHGEDRTGMVCAYWRVKVDGWPVEKAIEEMFAMGFHGVPYEWFGWVRALRGYLK